MAIFVFGLFAETDPDRCSPPHINSWEFYVVDSASIELHFGNQKSVRLSRIRELTEPAGHKQIKYHVKTLIDTLDGIA